MVVSLLLPVKTPTKPQVRTAARHNFPLGDSYDFTLGCSLCSKSRNNHEWQISHNHSGCLKNRLFVRRKELSSSVWIRIRMRQSKTCTSTYNLCWNFPNKECTSKNPETCWFAHSEEEKKIWNAEKFEGFSIDAFINQNKGASGATAASKAHASNQINGKRSISDCIQTFRKMYTGEFTVNGNVLFYADNGCEIRISKPRNCSAKYQLCQDNYCYEDHCLRSHTEVERDFWLLSLDTDQDFKSLSEHLVHRKATTPKNEAGQQTLKDARLPLDPEQNPLEEYYCLFCLKQCNSQTQFNRHCDSKAHMDKVTTEDGNQWQHRPPPPGLKLRLCYRYVNNIFLR